MSVNVDAFCCCEYAMGKKRVSNPPVPTSSGGARLSRSQRALDKKLSDIDGNRIEQGQEAYGLSRIYQGSIYVMGDLVNVDRFAHAAHGFRELMEKLARSVPSAQVPSSKGSPPTLNAMVKDIGKAWGKAKRNTKNLNGGKWEGVIDPHIAKFLGSLEHFFNAANTFKPPKAHQGENLLKYTDFQWYPLPEQIERIRIQEWRAYDEYFQRIAHHGSLASEDEFARYVRSFEEFLLARLIPKTSRSKRTLLAIIKEGEGNV
ncbi:hypothetical protein COMA1_50147 [Candidatus Nitrospira nitrosa]|uniref:Uncharacterized protein n=1 Tax=Candidatus Nitrospira nitrosa TaxID=1742972 RepID=A0A0S4LLZ7_9BACT|nr:hypothetical protein COMA1_50147 [Candidatus Nitrospira nitrosa]